MPSRYSTSEVLEALFDDDFGISNSKLSNVEGCLLGKANLNHAEVERLGRDIGSVQ